MRKPNLIILEASHDQTKPPPKLIKRRLSSDRFRNLTLEDELIRSHVRIFNCVRQQKLVAWTKPPVDWTKLNCDESCRGNPGISGVGGVIKACDWQCEGCFFHSFWPRH